MAARCFTKWLLCAFLAGAFFVSAALAGEGEPAGPRSDDAWESSGDAETARPSAAGKVLVIPAHGMIAGGMQELFERELERAAEEEPRLIVVEIDSPGGIVSNIEPICKALLKAEAPTVALVLNQAISGGAMIATACDEIVMLEGATLGDVEPHNMLGELPDAMREKIETTIRADMRANAQANGYPDKILESMVTKSFELYRVTFEDGTHELLYDNELELLEEQIASGESDRAIADRTIIVKKGNLLTLTAREAVEYGVAAEMVATVTDFHEARGISESELVRAVAPEGSGFGFNLPVHIQFVLAAFLIIGIAGVVVESQVPGFGLPGVVGVIGFSCFFALLFFNGRAEWVEIALFIIGIALLLVEIFVIPGFGVAGIAGVASILGAVVFSYLPPLRFVRDWSDEIGSIVSLLGIGVFGAIGLSVLLVKYLPRIPFLNQGLVLTNALPGGRRVVHETRRQEAGKYPHEEEKSAREKSLMGLEGVTRTVLRPSGKMESEDGTLYDVVSNGVIVPEGARVRIVDVNGPRIEVRQIEETQADKA